MQIAVAQRLDPLDFGTAALRIAVLDHHVFQMVLGLCVAVAEEGRFFGIADDVRSAVMVAVDGDVRRQRIGCSESRRARARSHHQT